MELRWCVIGNTGINLGGRESRIEGGKKRNSCIFVGEMIEDNV